MERHGIRYGVMLNQLKTFNQQRFVWIGDYKSALVGSHRGQLFADITNIFCCAENLQQLLDVLDKNKLN